MNYLQPLQFRQLKAFFLALKGGHFRVGSEQNLATILVDGMPTPVNKNACLDLLRLTFPDFQGEAFKDNNFLMKYLSDPAKRNHILGKLTPEQQLELAKSLAEKTPVVTEAAREQPGGQQTATGQITPVGTTNVSTRSMPFGMPSAPSITSIPRVFIAPQTPIPVSGMEGGTGLGTAATNKAQRLQQKTELTKASAVTTPLQTTPLQTNPLKTTPLSTTPLHTTPIHTTPLRTSPLTSNPFTKNPGLRFQPGLASTTRGLGSTLSRGFYKAFNAGLATASGMAGLNSGVGNNIFSWGRSKVGGSRSIFSRFGGFGRGGGGRASSSVVKTAKKRWLWLLLAGIIALVAISAIGGAMQSGGAPVPTSTLTGTTGSTDISSCKFTRAGNSQLIKSSTLQGWIVNAAAAAGIPSQILASVAMHESQDFTANADDNHYVDEIKNNQYCNKGHLICVAKNNRDVLHPKKGEDSPCTPEEIATGARTAQAIGLMQNLDIFNPGKDLCSITENLSIAATKLKADGITTQPTEDQSNKAIDSYYGSCSYGSFNYCNEVWQDFQNCQPSTTAVTPPATGTIPVVKEGHSCVTNTSFVPFPGYDNIKTGNYSYVCGHCTPIYNAIDAGVNPAGGSAVVAVTDGTTEDVTNPVGGIALWLNGNDNRNYYYAHLQRGGLVVGPVKAGQVIGTIAAASDASAQNNGVAHVHFSAGTPGNRQDRADPANIAAGPLLDTWCGNNVCNGKPNVAYSCGGGW